MTLWRMGRLIVGVLLMVCNAFSEEAEIETTDLCTVMRSPHEYSGRIVIVSGTLSRGKIDEWYLVDFSCLTLGRVFVVKPYQVKPRLDFYLDRYFFLDSDPVALLYMQGPSWGFRLDARFEGRIDWGEEGAKPRKRIRQKGRFGSENVPLRMVLLKISESSLSEIPAK